VWLVNLDPTVGPEIHKTRPAVIVSDDAVGALPLKVIVPLTEWKDRYSAAGWLVRVEPDAQNGLQKLSAADAFQVRSVAQQRFVQRLGRLSDAAMEDIAEALAVVLTLRM
jgi:mRNA interferase MazF